MQFEESLIWRPTTNCRQKYWWERRLLIVFRHWHPTTKDHVKSFLKPSTLCHSLQPKDQLKLFSVKDGIITTISTSSFPMETLHKYKSWKSNTTAIWWNTRDNQRHFHWSSAASHSRQWKPVCIDTFTVVIHVNNLAQLPRSCFLHPSHHQYQKDHRQTSSTILPQGYPCLNFWKA